MKNTGRLQLVNAGVRFLILQLEKPHISKCATDVPQMGVAQNETGGANRRFWSMFPLTRATHFGTGFLSHSQMKTPMAMSQWLATSSQARTHKKCLQARTPEMAVVVIKSFWLIPFWLVGEFTAHFRT